MVVDLLVEAFIQSSDADEVAAEALRQQAEDAEARTLEELLGDEGITFENPNTGEEEVVDVPNVAGAAGGELLELLGEIPEESQELILEEIRPEVIDGQRGARESIQAAEGGALLQALGVVGATLGVEIAGATQLESHQFAVSQILTFLALENVLGKELEVTVAEGVQPRLEQEINAEYRSKQVDIQDVIEQDLRNKDSDEDFIDDVSTYGVKPEQVSILEEVAITEVQPEELIETPAEAGVLPDEETLEAELDRAGISEDAKDVFRETVEQLPRTTRLVQEQLTLDELLRVLDTRVQNGTLSVDDAMAALPDDADEAREALRERFELLAANARDELSEADKLGHYSLGITTLDTAGEELSTPGREDSEVGRLLVEETLSEIDGDMRQALGLGLIDDSEFTARASIAGLDQDVVNRLLDGEDLDEIANSRLVSSDTEAGQSVESIIGIGSARGSALTSAGVETVTDLANADPEEVSDIAQVSVDVAQDFVDAATRRTQNQS